MKNKIRNFLPVSYYISETIQDHGIAVQHKCNTWSVISRHW